MGYFYILGTVIFAVIGQICIKWRVMQYGSIPSGMLEKFSFVAKVIVDPYVLLGFLAAFLSSVFWIGAMSKFELSFAYPFTSLSFILIMLASYFIFNESITTYKIIGLLFIVAGIIITSRSA